MRKVLLQIILMLCISAVAWGAQSLTNYKETLAGQNQKQEKTVKVTFENEKEHGELKLYSSYTDDEHNVEIKEPEEENHVELPANSKIFATVSLDRLWAVKDVVIKGTDKKFSYDKDKDVYSYVLGEEDVAIDVMFEAIPWARLKFKEELPDQGGNGEFTVSDTDGLLAETDEDNNPIKVAVGEPIYIQALPKEGYYLETLKVGSVDLLTGNYYNPVEKVYTWVVDKAHEKKTVKLEHKFVKNKADEFSVTLNVADEMLGAVKVGDIILKSGANPIKKGKHKISVILNEGCTLTEFKVAGEDKLATATAGFDYDIDKNITIQAKFKEPDKAKINVIIHGNGKVKIGDNEYPYGQHEIYKISYPVMAIPDFGHKLTRLTIGNSEFTSGNIYKFVDDVVDVAATFEPDPPSPMQVDIAITITGAGKVKIGDKLYAAGTHKIAKGNHKVEGVADAGNKLKSLKVGDQVNFVSGTEYNFTANVTINAEFEVDAPAPTPDNVDVTIAIVGNGKVKLGATAYAAGTHKIAKGSHKVEGVADAGNKLKSLKVGDQVNFVSGTEYNFTANVTINAEFEVDAPAPTPDNVDVTIVIVGNGKVKIGETAYAAGTHKIAKGNHKVEGVADAGNKLKSLKVGDQVNFVSGTEYNFTANVTINAEFEVDAPAPTPDNVDVTIAIVGNGKVKIGETAYAAGMHKIAKGNHKVEGVADAGNKLKSLKVGDQVNFVSGTEYNFTANVTINAEFEVEPTVAVEDILLANVVVAPNPFATQLNIRNEEFIQGRYELLNTEGSVLRSGVLEMGETVINTEVLPSGLYLLRLSAEKAVKVLKVVKE